MQFVALMAVRILAFRYTYTQFLEELSKKTLKMAVGTPDMWDSLMGKAWGEETDVLENVSYEEMREFVNSAQYTVELMFKGFQTTG